MVAILFDLEGTLVQSDEENLIGIKEFRSKVLKQLIALGIPSYNLKGIQTTSLMQNIAFDIVEKTYDTKGAKNFYLKLDSFLKKYELKWAIKSKLYGDTQDALHKLGRQYILGIVTNTSKDATDIMLSNHNISDFFRVVITRNDVKKLKPDPEGIRIALNRLGETQFVYVGNSSYDSMAAKEAGGTSITVKRDPIKVLKFSPDYIVTSLVEISDLLIKFG